MFSMLRNRFGVPGVIAVIALVLAMVGGAYAAAKLNGTQKKEVEKIAKKFAGKNGATGATGAQGPAGANGKDGAKGEQGLPGTPGTNGKSIVTETESAGANCIDGGSSFHQEGSGTKTYACNGQTGFTETLPSEKTETGTWGGELTGVASGEQARFTVSFPIPLAESIEGSNVVVVPTSESPVNEHCDNGTGEAPSAINPEADPGFFCIFQGLIGTPLGAGKVDGSSGVGVSGAVVTALLGFSGNAFGSWAVTAP